MIHLFTFWFFEQMWKDLEEKRSCKSPSQRHLESYHVAASLVPGLLIQKKMLQALCKWITFDRAAAKQQKKTEKTS